MRPLLLLLLAVTLPPMVTAQEYLSNNGVVTFFSYAAIEDITASNNKVSSVFKVATRDIAFSVQIRSFVFAKKLMQEHFNEKYMESEKFPVATFAGKVEGYNPLATGIQNVKTRGNLTIHGITRQVEFTGTLENVKGQTRLRSKFIVRLADYRITIPTMFWQNIAEQVEVRIEVAYPAR